jgi:multiple sugar transport system permease protein
VVTAISLLIGVFAAYALARLNFRGKFLVLGFILGASMFPGVALITPLFQLFTNIGWMGTYQALIIPNISFVLPLTVYTMTSFFREMPWELEESARVDGCTQGQAFRKVIMPLAAPLRPSSPRPSWHSSPPGMSSLSPASFPAMQPSR